MSNKLGWITIIIFAVFLLYLATNNRTSWQPDPLTNQITMKRHYWFKKNIESPVKWLNGGWHIKTQRGWEPLRFDEDISDNPPSPY